MPSATERLRVLLVEDDRDLAEVTQAALELEGLEVAVAYDGRDGLVKPVHPRELADCARKAWRHAHAA